MSLKVADFLCPPLREDISMSNAPYRYASLKRKETHLFEITLRLANGEFSGTLDLRLDPYDPLISLDSSEESPEVLAFIRRLWKLVAREAIARAVHNPAWYGLDRQFQFWTVPISYLDLLNKEFAHETSAGTTAVPS